MKTHTTNEQQQKIIRSTVMTPIKRGIMYEWKYDYNLIEGNEISSYAIIFFYDENKKQSGIRTKLFKKTDGATTDTLRFIAPLYANFAQCAFFINNKKQITTCATKIELSDVARAAVVETDNEREQYDDLFDYHKKYEPIDLETEPWNAIGGKHNHKGTIKEFAGKVTMLKNRYGLNPDSKILDIGCGTAGLGHELQGFLASDENYVGVELVQKGVDYCKKQYPQFRFFKGEMTSVPKFDEKFDFITLFNVIIHMQPEDSIALFKDAKQYLKEGGIFLITATINPDAQSCIGDKGRMEMTDEYFVELMQKAGFTSVEKIFKDTTEGQMPFIVKV